MLVEEPGSEYLGHVTPSASSAHSIETAIATFFEEQKVDTSELIVIGGNGTAVNTGHSSGVMSQLEKRIGRPFQRVVCLLHTNELPLRHLFQSLDGKSTGPSTYSGPLGTL